MSEPTPDPRPSRQNLVVPPAGGSSTRLVAGAVACAALGFGVVWGLGLGTRQPDSPDEPVPAVAEHDAADHPAADAGGHASLGPAEHAQPDLLPPPDDAVPLPPPTSDRWSRRGGMEAAAETTTPSGDGPLRRVARRAGAAVDGGPAPLCAVSGRRRGQRCAHDRRGGSGRERSVTGSRVAAGGERRSRGPRPPGPCRRRDGSAASASDRSGSSARRGGRSGRPRRPAAARGCGRSGSRSWFRAGPPGTSGRCGGIRGRSLAV